MAKHSPLQLHSPVRLWATRLALTLLAFPVAGFAVGGIFVMATGYPAG